VCVWRVEVQTLCICSRFTVIDGVAVLSKEIDATLSPSWSAVEDADPLAANRRIDLRYTCERVTRQACPESVAFDVFR